MKKDETFVHVAMRTFLKQRGWLLIAGQYPGGSDDELHVFNVFDPALARDESPDHRRHSFGKLVPDLIAYKNNRLIIVEAKPEYSTADKEKLNYLLSERRTDFLDGIERYIRERGFYITSPRELEIIPALAFLAESSAPDDGFAYLKVTSLDHLTPVNIEI